MKHRRSIFLIHGNMVCSVYAFMCVCARGGINPPTASGQSPEPKGSTPATTTNVVCIICCCKKKQNKAKQIGFRLGLSPRTFLIYIAAFCRCLCLLTGLCLPGAYCPGLNSFLRFRDRTWRFVWGILLPRTKKNQGLCPYRPEGTDLDFPRSLCPYRPQRGTGLDSLHSIFESLLSVSLHCRQEGPRWEPAVCWDSDPPKQRN